MNPQRAEPGPSDARPLEDEGRFHAIFSQAPVGIAQTSLTGEWVHINDRLCEILGYTPAELRSTTFLDITHPDDRDSSRGGLRQLVSGEISSWVTEKRYLRKNGTTIWGQLFMSLVRDPSNQPQHFIAVVADATARIQSEHALQEKQQQLRLALSAGLGVWEVDLRAAGVALSPQYKRVFGDTPLSYGDWMKLIHPDDRDRVVAIARRGFERAQEWEAEFRVLWPDGRVRWMLSKGSVILDQDRRPARMVGVSLDITERVLAQEQRSHLASIVESTDLAIMGETVDGRIVSWNKGAEKLYGYRADEVIGRHFTFLVPKELRGELPPILERLGQGESIEHLEVRRVRKDGKLITVSLTVSPIRDSAGAVVGVSAISRDITDWKQAEAAVRESEERFRTVFEEGPLGVALVGKDHRFLKVNRALCQMVGYPEAELVQKSFAEITHPDDIKKGVDLANRLFAREIPFFHMEKRYLKKNGEIIWANLTASVIHDREGEPLYVLSMLEDITEVKRAHEEAVARQKLESVGLLASGIAHDFNNLLGGIVAEAELAEMAVAESESPRESIQTIKSVAYRGAEIVRELMMYSGQDQCGPVESVDLSRLVTEMLELFKVSISKHVVLKTELPDNLPAVLGRVSQLSQVLMNLIINASEAIGEKSGTITIAASRTTLAPDRAAPPDLPPGEYLKLQVSDTGFGMTEEVRAKVFDPFFSTKFAGRGMGLAVVHRIVRDCGGAITVASTPGQGTTFELLLPADTQIADSSSVIAAAGAVAKHATVSGTVLVVEDEEPLRQAVSTFLRKNGLRVIEANDGSSALELIRTRGDIDAMLLDMTLPGISSREVLKAARHIRCDLKVILTSAYSKETVDSFFEGMAIERFIRKPFELVNLKSIVQEALSQ